MRNSIIRKLYSQRLFSLLRKEWKHYQLSNKWLEQTTNLTYWKSESKTNFTRFDSSRSWLVTRCWTNSVKSPLFAQRYLGSRVQNFFLRDDPRRTYKEGPSWSVRLWERQCESYFFSHDWSDIRSDIPPRYRSRCYFHQSPFHEDLLELRRCWYLRSTFPPDAQYWTRVKL